jgi:pimeloyl-ACP methyl ester carboxylesterase
MQATRVEAPDGVSIAAQEWGNRRGREILFIHGFNQSHLSWFRQVTDSGLAEKFRMVTYDLRGHGGSDKPTDNESYTGDGLWADEVAAVIAATGLKRPVIVGWSYAGRVIADYLRTHGPDGIAGINYVDARCATDSALFGPGRRHFAGMQSDDLAASIAGTRGFLRACFERQPSADDFETMLSFNMMVPPKVRRHILGRPSDTTEAMAKLGCPVLVTHGRSDQIVLPAMGEFVAATVTGARLSLYDGVGHSPFWEDAPRFNTELAAFAGTTR